MLTLRSLGGAALLGSLTLASSLAFADGSGTLDDQHSTLHHDGGPFLVSNPTPAPAGIEEPLCEEGTPTCEVYTLTVNISDTIRADANAANFFVDFALGFPNAQADMDLYLYDSSGEPMGSSTGGFGAQELVSMPLDLVPNGDYRVVVIPWVVVPGDSFALDIGLTGLSSDSKSGLLGFAGALSPALLLPLLALVGLRRRAPRA